MPRLTLSILILMATVLAGNAAPRHDPAGDAIPNRVLAFGDSITYGDYSPEPYPAQLEETLNLRVGPWEVVNGGNPGEATFGGSERITGAVSTHLPAYVLILEGTNDVTRGKLAEDVYDNLVAMIDNARLAAGVSGVQVMLATIVPRLDELNDETAAINEQVIIPVAQAKGVPVCDLWTAFVSQTNWPALYADDTHPNAAGLALIARTFYGRLLEAFPEISEETTPPQAWMDPVPEFTECGESIPASWGGSDDLSWITSYDLQARIGDGEWQDWLQDTGLTEGLFRAPEARFGQQVAFRVRGRDLVGNVGPYSAPVYSTIADSVAPHEAHVEPLPDLLMAPFTVRWWALDACADVTSYDVQYSAAGAEAWTDWLPSTAGTSAAFDPASPQFGQAHAFRVRAQDEAGNWSAWSDAGEASTTLCAGLGGRIRNLRGQPIAGAQVEVAPTAERVAPLPGGGFVAYLAATGSHDVAAGRPDLYGPLPAMHGVQVQDDVLDLQLVLPALDDAVIGGGFEGAGGLDTWELGGTLPPRLSDRAHTGLASAELGGTGGRSLLGQRLRPPPVAENLTLSFMARLAEPGPPASLLLTISGGSVPTWTISHTLAVDNTTWRHAWYDLDAAVRDGPPSDWALTLVVSGSPAVLVDEIGLGSAVVGGHALYLPLTFRNR